MIRFIPLVFCLIRRQNLIAKTVSNIAVSNYCSKEMSRKKMFVSKYHSEYLPSEHIRNSLAKRDPELRGLKNYESQGLISGIIGMFVDDDDPLLTRTKNNSDKIETLCLMLFMIPAVI